MFPRAGGGGGGNQVDEVRQRGVCVYTNGSSMELSQTAPANALPGEVAHTHTHTPSGTGHTTQGNANTVDWRCHTHKPYTVYRTVCV